ncbi:MAG: glycosyltransferase family 2 protein, partial [Saprospiraceae bacterium]|nr:glycosyltransferase family 2 protein [Saprospiraceae bacterium]
MAFVYGIFSVLAAVTVLQLTYPFATVLLSRLFGRERLGKKEITEQHYHYACIVTAYRNSAIAKPLVESLLRQNYPHLIIYVVADECPDFDFGITDARFVLLRPATPLRLKAKSIIHALHNYRRPPDYTVVFDADNLAHPQFLTEINRYANAGYVCIQGQRTAKNLDTTYAALDAMGEHYKNYIERYVPYLLGGSAVISGSGMATRTDVYRAYLDSPEIQQGQTQGKKMLQEDKILQNFLLRQDHHIAYARQAIVYDEKVETGAAVTTQRSRWLFSYFQNLPNSSGLLLRGLGRGSWNQLYFGFITLVLPMFIQLAAALGLALLGLFIAPVWSLVLVGAVAVFSLNILWTLRLDAAP